VTNFSNVLTQALGMKFPILLAPMAGGPTTPELVSAVSDAGGFGQFGAAYLKGKEIKDMAYKVQNSTNKGFGINLFIPHNPTYTEQDLTRATSAISKYYDLFDIKPPVNIANTMPNFDEQIKAVIESGTKLCSFHLGVPLKSDIEALKAVGILTTVSVTSVKEGEQAENLGVDFIIAQGSEAGGHRGTWVGDWRNSMTGTMSLLAQLKQTTSTPIIAAGGIMNGSSMAAAMTLGAVGVQMGTAFLTCPESGVNSRYKQALLDVIDDNTIVTQTFSGRPARGLRNNYIDEMEKSGAYTLPFPLQNILTSSLRKAASKENDTDYMSMWCGQAASLSRGIPAVKLIETILKEYEEAIFNVAI